jgi:hypothetical protein
MTHRLITGFSMPPIMTCAGWMSVLVAAIVVTTGNAVAVTRVVRNAVAVTLVVTGSASVGVRVTRCAAE